MANRNALIVPQAARAMDQLKVEIAAELGMPDYEHVDKGNLTARENGYVGGLMVRRLVQLAQQELSERK